MKKNTKIPKPLCLLLTLLLALPAGVWGQDPTPITDLAGLNAMSASGSYIITADIDASSFNADISSFSGTLEAAINNTTKMPYRIKNLQRPLFTSMDGGTVRNLVLEDVNISNYSGNTGAVTSSATGATKIYNVGILSGSVGGTAYTGGLVGFLDGTARVINCYSYADITGGSDVGGIVGYNNGTTTASSINTMVMNCMFYGDITGGSNKSPVYGGNNIANLQGGLNTFNYYAYSQLPTDHLTSSKYNSALAVEEKYLNRFEFYRLLLNSNKKLAMFYITGNASSTNQMAKWVLETADRSIDNPKPYPILKAQGYYPSIINPDFANAPDSSDLGRNHGGKLGKTLSVTISESNTTSGGQTKPASASITTSSLTLNRTDKDFDRFNYNYDKVQLPYYNDVGEGNYTGNRVVTGWKIISMSPTPASDPYISSNYPTTGITDYPDHNYADRKSVNKDLYTVSGRVFSQGAYFDVPYGVTSITIEPYWGKACYIADQNYDVVYKNDYSGKQNVTRTGTQVSTSNPKTKFNGQSVETSITRALDTIANNLGGLGSTVYDNALVLVGNLHLDVVPLNGDRPFTMMSVDEDNDHEPDYSLIYHHKGRTNITPIRFDFLNIPGTAQAQKPNGASLICNFTIVKTRGWFEITNTSLVHSDQFEYENADLGGPTKIDAPLILLGGIFDQFVSTQSKAVSGKTIYIHVGGNVWIKEFGMGTHSDGSESTPHVPVSVTGGEFPGFYLTGTYNANAKIREDNAECYISGGYFHEAAGASQEGINGNVRWQIFNADIDNFYGGGTNDAKPIQGDVTIDIYNSHVGTYCGGPKFGNMQSNKNVTTNAVGCTFGTYFGAGYGGLSYSRKKYYDNTSPAWGTTLQGYYTTDKGKYFDGTTTNSRDGGTGNNQYGKKGPGVATDFDYEFFVWSSGSTGGRFFVKFASFSLAQCHKVSSSLKKCTIENNFYGGGSLGKVVGTVTSELEDCIVKGNVFGAGFSASLPTLEVRDAGFTQNPNYNSASGMFEPGIFSGTTTFEWKNASEAGVTLTNNNSGSDLTNHYIYTDVDLSKSNLGSVSGNVTITIKGSTTVGTFDNEGHLTSGGNVYGGGDESAVNNDESPADASTTVILQQGAHIGGNVYGGGNNGAVSGNSEVRIQDPEP
ncbi:MAG: ZmpA/ZmpB/ZmpC family metallo-endopeptidase-related protein [bacterium]